MSYWNNKGEYWELASLLPDNLFLDAVSTRVTRSSNMVKQEFLLNNNYDQNYD